MSNQIIGHKKVINFLNRSIQKNKISHAYLFEGPERIGKKMAALEFVKAVQDYKKTTPDPSLPRRGIGEIPPLLKGEINKANPDLLVISPEKGESINIAQIRELQSRLSLSPHSKKYKIAIIDNAEAMTREAANSLLKTLEEPSATTIIILVVSSGENILPTIRSRCQTIKFLIPSTEELRSFLKSYQKSDQEIEQLISFSCQKPGVIINLLNDQRLFERQKNDFEKFSKIINSGIFEKMNYAEEISKEELERIESVLNLWTVFLRNSFLNCYSEDGGGKNLKHKITGFIKEIQKGKSLILKKKANAKLVLENLLINC